MQRVKGVSKAKEIIVDEQVLYAVYWLSKLKLNKEIRVKRSKDNRFELLFRVRIISTSKSVFTSFEIFAHLLNDLKVRLRVTNAFYRSGIKSVWLLTFFKKQLSLFDYFGIKLFFNVKRIFSRLL